MDLSERKRQILKAIIEHYIATAEPVGSKLLAAAGGASVSSATIRNEMSELEELGYIEKPHTSAGRAPTPLGYRFYVDELMSHCYATALEIRQIQKQLESKLQQLDRAMDEASAILSELTGQPTVSLSARHSHRQVKRLELISIQPGDYALVAVTHPPGADSKALRLSAPLGEGEGAAFCQAANLLLEQPGGADRLNCLEAMAPSGSPLAELVAAAVEFVDQIERRQDSYGMAVQGAARLLGNPEFYDAQKARALLEFLSDKEKVLALTQDPEPRMLNIRIGPENGQGAMQDASFVFTSYDLGEDISGVIGVIGPTRMDYSKIASRLLLLSRGLQGLMPIRFPEEQQEDDNR